MNEIKNLSSYYYIIMSQNDLLKNEAIEEIIREKANYYNSKKKFLDFWLVLSPKFIFNENFYKQLKNTNFFKSRIVTNSTKIVNNEKNSYVAIVSTDKKFLTWLSLRIGYFETVNFTDKIINKLPDSKFVSNGIFGEIELKNDISPFLNNSENINKNILINRYETFLNLI